MVWWRRSLLAPVASLALTAVVPARAVTRDVGDVAVIEDVDRVAFCNPDSDPNCFYAPDMLCREAAKIFYQTHCDEYDGLVAFRLEQVTNPILQSIVNVQQGTPVQQSEQGIGRDPFDWTAQYGSAGRLAQCVSMQGLYSLPDNPDGPAQALFGLPLGLSGIELLGHEYGHHWLMSVAYDLGDGQGPRTDLRGWENGGPNNHYSGRVDSHSVMYGNFITDQGGGSFLSCGGTRGFNPLDQYLMGLRAASEVPPLLLVDDGTGQGDPSVATPDGTCNPLTGTARWVTVDDVIRAEGPRVPDVTTSQKDLRVAFLLVTPAGVEPTAQELAKVEAYRQRFEQWWPVATEGRGSVDTHLGTATCGTPPPTDGGVPDASTDGGGVDAGTPDAGDAGAGTPDGGRIDAGPDDAGLGDGGGSDGGTAWPWPDAGTSTAEDGGKEIGRLDVGGCQCTAAGPRPPAALSTALLLLAALGAAALRRR
jgi:MYXO-CTERM domain-containing protein